jgi:heavy metal sensor kinase
MTLTNRLSSSFLGALGLILIGFSTALYSMASAYLQRSVDERLSATLATLSAMAEDEPGGFDWEHDERRAYPGHDSGVDQVRWIVFDDKGSEVDRSRNLANADRIESPGLRRLDRQRIPWRVVQLRLNSNHSAEPSDGKPGRFSSVVLQAGLRLDPIEGTLRTLAVALAILSTLLWVFTAIVGRWICRRALAPLTKMAITARELGVDEPSRRLPVVVTGDELEDLAFAFNGLLDRWHEALERQSRFAGDASHQLRTPLTALIGQVDVALRRDRPPEEYRRTLSRVRDQSERLRRIVEALLFLARADAEASLPALEEFDLVAWVSEQVRQRLDESSAEPIRWDEPPGPIPVRSHPALLAEVFHNLLDNARDHGGAGLSTEIKVVREGDCVALNVQDHGRGISPADLSKVFEPFYRAPDARKSVPNGVGLGLAVARRIAEALGGKLEAESEPGRGSRFTVRLKIARLDRSLLVRIPLADLAE